MLKIMKWKPVIQLIGALVCALPAAAALQEESMSEASVEAQINAMGVGKEMAQRAVARLHTQNAKPDAHADFYIWYTEYADIKKSQHEDEYYYLISQYPEMRKSNVEVVALVQAMPDCHGAVVINRVAADVDWFFKCNPKIEYPGIDTNEKEVGALPAYTSRDDIVVVNKYGQALFKGSMKKIVNWRELITRPPLREPRKEEEEEQADRQSSEADSAGGQQGGSTADDEDDGKDVPMKDLLASAEMVSGKINRNAAYYLFVLVYERDKNNELDQFNGGMPDLGADYAQMVSDNVELVLLSPSDEAIRAAQEECRAKVPGARLSHRLLHLPGVRKLVEGYTAMNYGIPAAVLVRASDGKVLAQGRKPVILDWEAIIEFSLGRAPTTPAAEGASEESATEAEEES